MAFFLNSLDSKAAQRLDGRMLLRLQDLRKEVNMELLFWFLFRQENTFYPFFVQQIMEFSTKFSKGKSPLLVACTFNTTRMFLKYKIM